MVNKVSAEHKYLEQYRKAAGKGGGRGAGNKGGGKGVQAQLRELTSALRGFIEKDAETDSAQKHAPVQPADAATHKTALEMAMLALKTAGMEDSAEFKSMSKKLAEQKAAE